MAASISKSTVRGTGTNVAEAFLLERRLLRILTRASRFPLSAILFPDALPRKEEALLSNPEFGDN